MAKFGVDFTVAGCSNFHVASCQYCWTRRPANLPLNYPLLLGNNLMLLSRQSFPKVSIHVLFLYSQNIFLDWLKIITTSLYL